MPKDQIATLFAKLQGRYGSKFSSQYRGIERVAMDEWATELAGITWEQVEAGLQAWKHSWPPSADEFLDACLGKFNQAGDGYLPEYYRTAPKVTDRSRLLSSDDRDRRRKVAGEQIKNLKAALNGAGSQPQEGEDHE